MKYTNRLATGISNSIYFILGGMLLILVLNFGAFGNLIERSIAIIAWFLLLFLFKFIYKIIGTSEKKIILVLVGFCFLLKLAWILLFQLKPENDFAMFYQSAAGLSENLFVQNRYMALFPHLFGYSFFLSIFMKVFGQSILLAPVLNVLLTTGSMVFLYFIAKRFGGVRSGVTAALLWILLPSQTIYNMFSFGEPLYCTAILGTWLLSMRFCERLQKMSLKRLLMSGVVIAALLAFINLNRPIAVVLLVALFIWLFAADAGLGNTRLLRKFAFAGAIVIFYAIFLIGSKAYIEYRLQEPVASIPGYSVMVGMNPKTNGMWNEEDSKLLYYYDQQPGMTADMAQKKMLEEALKRVRTENIDFASLLYNKYLIFLKTDDSQVGASYRIFNADQQKILYILSDFFYYILIIGALLGLYRAIRRKNRSQLFVIALFPIGLTIAQMVVEVHGRYHYSVLLSFILLAAYGYSDFISVRLSPQAEHPLN